MSWQHAVLNRTLRWFEKPQLARSSDPLALRRSFEAKARFWFRPPRATILSRDTLGGVPILWARAQDIETDRTLLYLHGGGYVFGSASTHSAMAAELARLSGARACLPDYRLAPEHPFPAALDDARAAYAALLETGVPATRIVLGGDSAGGGLALALLADLLARNEPCPAAVFAFSPLTDLTFGGGSWDSNAHADVMLPASRASEMAEMYLRAHDPRDPLASPLFADFAGAPPVWLCVGDTEVLLDDTTRLAAHLRASGVELSQITASDLPHVWPMFYRILPEGRATLRDLAGWIRQHWPPSSDES